VAKKIKAKTVIVTILLKKVMISIEYHLYWRSRHTLSLILQWIQGVWNCHARLVRLVHRTCLTS